MFKSREQSETFAADEQGGQFEHGLSETLRLRRVESFFHLLDHQPTQIGLSSNCLGEVDHTRHLQTEESRYKMEKPLILLSYNIGDKRESRAHVDIIRYDFVVLPLQRICS